MRRASIAFFCLLAASLAQAQWDQELLQLETGVATRAHLRGVEQARLGALFAFRLVKESVQADASWHQSFHRSDERLASLRLRHQLWSGVNDDVLEVVGAHRRFSSRVSHAAEHATEFGVRYQAAPIHGYVSSLYYARDVRRDADILEVRVDRAFALTKWGAFLNTALFVGWVDADDVSAGRPVPPTHDAYAYWGGEARLPYRVGERTMVVLAGHVGGADGASGAWSTLAGASRVRAGLDLSVTFDF